MTAPSGARSAETAGVDVRGPAVRSRRSEPGSAGKDVQAQWMREPLDLRQKCYAKM
jgi:hypothetical protein